MGGFIAIFGRNRRMITVIAAKQFPVIMQDRARLIADSVSLPWDKPNNLNKSPNKSWFSFCRFSFL